MEKDYIDIIQKRGTNIDHLFKDNLIEFEKFCRKNDSEANNLTKFLNEFEITFTEIDKIFISLFKYNSNNINYINYLIIIKSLNAQQLKNLYRFFIIKWYIFKKINYLEISNSIDMSYIQQINFEPLSKIDQLIIYDQVYELFILNIKDFIEKDQKINEGFNTHLHFIINNICQYLNLA